METTQVCINQEVSFISPPPADGKGRQPGTALEEQGPDPGLQEARPVGGQVAPGEAHQCLEVWPWLKPDEPCSLMMGRVWRPEEDEEEVKKTVGEKRGGDKSSGSNASPRAGRSEAREPQEPYHLGKKRIGRTCAGRRRGCGGQEAGQLDELGAAGR